MIIIRRLDSGFDRKGNLRLVWEVLLPHRIGSRDGSPVVYLLDDGSKSYPGPYDHRLPDLKVDNKELREMKKKARGIYAEQKRDAEGKTLV